MKISLPVDLLYLISPLFWLNYTIAWTKVSIHTMTDQKHIESDQTLNWHRLLSGGEPSGILAGGITTRRPGDRRRRDATDIFVLGYVMEGTGTFTIAGRSFTLGPGDVFQRYPGLPNRLQCDRGAWTHYWLRLDSALMTRLGELGCVNPTQGVLRPGLQEGLIAQFDAYFAEAVAATDQELPRILLNGVDLVQAVYARHRAVTGNPMPLAEQMIARLTQDLTYRGSLEDLFADLPASYSKLRRMFRQEMGTSPGEYRIRCRVERACSLLLAPDASVSGVAAALAYPNPYVFSAQFKQVVGLSPKAFMAQR